MERMVLPSAAMRVAVNATGLSGFYAIKGKRLLDMAIAAAILPFVLPVILVLALLVRLDGGPAFFGHKRVGQGGGTFRCLKLRTMVPDAETALKAYLDANPEERRSWALEFKLRNDPRVTPLGRVLRATSLDELPQIFNVLRGEMSLIGPRPVTVAELPLYGADLAVYLAQKPGISGLWQVSGRNDVSYAARVRMDRDYAATLCLTGDLALMARTVVAVLRRTGC